MTQVICLNSFRADRSIVAPRIVNIVDRLDQCDFEKIKDALHARFGSGSVPKHVIKAWDRPSNEPYRFGCTHNLTNRPRERYWNKPMPFPMDMDPDSDTLGRKVEVGGTDPCDWIDSKYGVTLNHIKNRSNKKLTIHTRSDLIARDDYMESLDLNNHVVVFYLLDATPFAQRILEPGAPSNARRMKAIEKLRAYGVNVQVINQIAKIRKAV